MTLETVQQAARRLARAEAHLARLEEQLRLVRLRAEVATSHNSARDERERTLAHAIRADRERVEGLRAEFERQRRGAFGTVESRA